MAENQLPLSNLYGRSIFCLPYQTKISDFIDLVLYWVYSVVAIIKFCCHQLKDCIRLKLQSYSFTSVNQAGRKPDILDNSKQKCLLFFSQNQGISTIVSPKNGTKKSLLKLALLESYQPHQPRGYGCGQHKTPAPLPMHAHQTKLNQGGIDSIKTSKWEDQSHDSIIIQIRLPGLTDLQNNESAETFVRPGICGLFFLWLSISRSQVITKRSLNDNFFRSK